MGNELVVAQYLPATVILPTEPLVRAFHEALLPWTVKEIDLNEIITQIAESIDVKDKAGAFMSFRHLPKFDRIASKQFFDTVERQHLLKAATFELACGIYKLIEDLGGFESYRFKNKFPYAFEKMLGMDASFFHIPF